MVNRKRLYLALGLVLAACRAVSGNEEGSTPMPQKPSAAASPTSLIAKASTVPATTPRPDKADLEKLCIYYGWPSLVNSSNTDTARASGVFSYYDEIIFGDGLSDTSHPDHGNTVEIIRRLHENNPKSLIYGYLNLGCTQPNPHVSQVRSAVAKWKDMGVDGIFMDCVSPDYNITAGLPKDSTKIVQDLGMRVFLNAFQPKWAVDNAPLDSYGALMIEPIFFSEGKPYTYPYLGSLMDVIKLGTRVYGVTTYDPASPLDLKRQQFEIALGSAIDLGLKGLAFVNSHYSAYESEVNEVLILK